MPLRRFLSFNGSAQSLLENLTLKYFLFNGSSGKQSGILEHSFSKSLIIQQSTYAHEGKLTCICVPFSSVHHARSEPSLEDRWLDSNQYHRGASEMLQPSLSRHHQPCNLVERYLSAFINSKFINCTGERDSWAFVNCTLRISAIVEPVNQSHS